MLKRQRQLPASRSCLLLGPRQTGKSTLVRSLLPKDAWTLDLLQHDVFARFAKEPARFRAEVLRGDRDRRSGRSPAPT